MDEAAYSVVHGEWPECLTSNYESSCRFDGDNGRSYTHPFNSGAGSGVYSYGLHWQGSADLQAPYFYHVDDDHIGVGESEWDASMRVNYANLEALIASYGGGHQGEISPWVEVVNQTFGVSGTVYSVTEADTRRLLSLLRSRDIAEFIAINGLAPGELDIPSCEDEGSWSLFAKVVDGVWGATVSGASVITGSTAQSPQAPIELALHDPLNVTAAAVGIGSYKVIVEVQYSSDFVFAPCKIAAIIEGTATNGATLASVEFYNYNTTGWDTAGTDPGYKGVPDQSWRVISATDHTDGGGNMKVRVTYSKNATFDVALDCVQAIAFAVPYLPGDVDGDGDVDDKDVGIVTDNQKLTVCKGTNGDLDRDGDVDEDDLYIVLNNYESTTFVCP